MFILTCGILTVFLGSYGMSRLFPTRTFLDDLIPATYLQIGVFLVGGSIFGWGIYFFRQFPRKIAYEIQSSAEH